MGLVFQLSDDRLGLFGDPVKTGKDVDSDAKTGKKTLYALYAHQKLQGTQAQKFHQLYGKADLSGTELQELQHLLTETGVAGMVDKVTTKYVLRAKQALKSLSAWPELQTLFTETLDFLVTRER
jgi:geranylgeranyl pyrophosphate synthase